MYSLLVVLTIGLAFLISLFFLTASLSNENSKAIKEARMKNEKRISNG